MILTKDQLKLAKPFLKWAGGKKQLLNQIQENFPEELLTGSITRYIEPFVGGGAVFFYVAQAYPIGEFYILDVNPELILAYQTIQKNVEELIEILAKIQAEYISLNPFERNQYFYQVRSDFNSLRQQVNFDHYNLDWITRTAQIIFLNRTCFNGLYRVNSKGEFNVPVGQYKNPTICDPKNLRAVSNILQRTTIEKGDFTQCKVWVNQQSLVYFDPPYRPISKTASFNAYSAQVFDDSEQLRLRDFYRELDQIGAKLILSNSDPKNEVKEDHFFDEIYVDYFIRRVKATRNINSNASKRGIIHELLITNYDF